MVDRPAGPRTDMGTKRIRVGDLVLVAIDGYGERLALVIGGYRQGTRWRYQLAPPPGTTVGWEPQSIKSTAVRVVWRRGRSR